MYDDHAEANGKIDGRFFYYEIKLGILSAVYAHSCIVVCGLTFYELEIGLEK